MTKPFQHTKCDEAVGGIVLGQQNSQWRRAGCGSDRPPPLSAGSIAWPPSAARRSGTCCRRPGWLSTAMVPPISSTSRRQIASPRPLPPNRREIEPSIWVNSWNIRSMASGSDADPAVRDAELQPDAGRPWLRLVRHRHADPALIGELHRVADEIEQDLPQPAGIAADRGRHRVVGDWPTDAGLWCRPGSGTSQRRPASTPAGRNRLPPAPRVRPPGGKNPECR